MTFNIDGNPRNADWTKKSVDEGMRTVDDLRRHLLSGNLSVDDFKAQPIYQMNQEFFDRLLAQL
jgi:hypothetical protein